MRVNVRIIFGGTKTINNTVSWRQVKICLVEKCDEWSTGYQLSYLKFVDLPLLKVVSSVSKFVLLGFPVFSIHLYKDTGISTGSSGISSPHGDLVRDA